MRGQTSEVANGLHFADFWKVFDFRARVLCAENFRCVHGRYIQIRQLISAFAGRAVFKQQRLVLIDVLADFLNHFAKTSATVSSFSRRLISVAQSSMPFSSSGYKRWSGRPPMIFFRS